MASIDLRQFKDPLKVEKISNTKSTSSGLKIFELLDRDIQIGGKELSDQKKEYLYIELSSLLEAGIDLKTSFELMLSDQKKPKDKELFESVQAALIGGASMSYALRQSSRFSLYEIYSIQIGEETGQLGQILAELAIFFKNKIKQKRRIISALSYPCIVIITSIVAVIFMLKYLVPMFSDVFQRFGGQLPWLTQKVVDLSKTFQHGFLPFICFMIAIIVLGIYQRDNVYFRKWTATVILKMPIVGVIVHRIYLARFCSSMRLLIGARLPLLRATALIRQMIAFYPIESSLAEIEKMVMQGASLNQSMSKFSIYPSKLVQLIKVGEETGNLDSFFAKIGEQYVDEVEYRTTTLSSMLEPLIVIGLGLVVGVILIAMYLPLFEMSSSFQ